MRRIHPSPTRDVTIAEAYDVERTPPTGRPWVAMCMVASIDGSTALSGRSGGLSNASDRAVLVTLRRLADVILVGAGTVRAEGYGAPSKPGQRIGVVSNSGEVDTTTELFTSGAGFLVVPHSTQVAGAEVLRAGGTTVDLADAVARLHEVAGHVGYVHVEGGSTLNGAMLGADLLDELDVTISPRLVGGDGPRITSGAPELDARYELAHLLVDDESFVFSRWVRRRAC